MKGSTPKAVPDLWYQINQVVKEFDKFGTLGEYRIERLKETIAKVKEQK